MLSRVIVDAVKGKPIRRWEMTFKHLVVLVAVVFLAVMVSSCAKKPPVTEPTEELPVLVEEEPVEEPVEEPIEEPVIPPAPAETYGYRVQIGAFVSQQNAEMFAAAARSRFTETVYVQYVEPYYKVRVGDLLSRGDAEMLKAKVLQLGYPGSFIVESMITPY
jgi:cell division septation protein DedD